MSKTLRNTVCIKCEEERHAEEVARKQDLDERRAEEKANGVPEEELSTTRSSILEEFVRDFQAPAGAAKLMGLVHRF